MIEIPFGTDTNGKMVSLPLVAHHRNHCCITGFPGSGKSTLLRSVINSVENHFDKTQVVIWSDFFNHNNEKQHGNTNVDIRVPDTTPQARMAALIDLLYEEAQASRYIRQDL